TQNRKALILPSPLTRIQIPRGPGQDQGQEAAVANAVGVAAGPVPHLEMIRTIHEAGGAELRLRLSACIREHFSLLRYHSPNAHSLYVKGFCCIPCSLNEGAVPILRVVVT